MIKTILTIALYVSVEYCRGQYFDYHDLELGRHYTNLTTKGDLVSDIYRVVVDTKNPPPAIRVSVASENASLKHILAVTVVRGKTVHNIALSRLQSHRNKQYEYWFATDTLCDNDRSIEQRGQPVHVSVSSILPSKFGLLVKSVENFNIGTEIIKTAATPPEPR
ncbi:TransThyretin-Related family domain [Caenorhabditis elegans]|uniref:TransThyretin-Related family domain n=1 Tax=Caenorhabditis elegans TaxID=6239 RepID=Q20196_CAEEL|nr:TransThyretin-Related family domain [Caenorhabditis elegans]CCD66184.2 TransThyretin-Related family domain [Caenorhabditis elegans]